MTIAELSDADLVAWCDELGLSLETSLQLRTLLVRGKFKKLQRRMASAAEIGDDFGGQRASCPEVTALIHSVDEDADATAVLP